MSVPAEALRLPSAAAEPLAAWLCGSECNFCLDEYRADNGGTLIVPGSSRIGRHPNDAAPHLNTFSEPPAHVPPEAEYLLAPSGSVVLYHAATWHRLSVNVSPNPRIGVLQ